jgi:hypothetical protein
VTSDSRTRVLLVSVTAAAQGTLQDRLTRKKWKLEWADVIRDLDNLIEMRIAINDKSFVFRGQNSGVAGKVFQACGVALPPVRRSTEVTSALAQVGENVSLQHF